MATKHVIAYVMHEIEHDMATQTLQNVQQTDSYVIGDIDEDRIEELRRQGLVVDELAPPGRPTTAAMARGTLAAGRGAQGWRAGDDGDIPPPEPDVTTQWLVSLGGPLMEDMRLAIESTGTELKEYVPGHAYVAAATPEQATQCINLPFVLDVARYGPAATGPIALTAGPAVRGEEAVGRVWDLWLTDTASRAPVLSWMEQREIVVVGSGGRKVRIELGPELGLQREVSTLPGVLSMVEHVPPKLFNDIARELLGVTPVQPGGHPMPYTGRGQVVAVADTGLMDGHPDLKRRILDVVALGRPGNTSDPIGHGTHVAGSVLGDGTASAGRYRGVAPEAQLYFQSLLDSSGGLNGLPVSLADLFEPAYQAGARIHNNSWGAATSSAYTVDSNDVDDFVATRRDMLVVIAAGNEGTAASPFNAQRGFVDWLSIGSPASCKNALTVGAARTRRSAGGLAAREYGDTWRRDFPNPPIADQRVSGDPQCLAAFSSRGPCDDRRIKPDVVAPGTDIISTRSDIAPEDEFWGVLDSNSAYAYMGGTSMACPLVAGCAALVREYYVSEGADPSAALLKATIVNGTQWLTGADSVADHQQRPNYHQGFGAVYLPSTIPNPGEPNLRLVFTDAWKQPGLQLDETGRRVRFEVKVDPGTPLRICMAYTDLPGRALQNDVSLLVQDPTGVKFVGNADLPGRINQSDVENNVEAIRVEQPAPGTWLIQVFARNLLRGPQDYALVITGSLTSPLRRVPN